MAREYAIRKVRCPKEYCGNDVWDRTVDYRGGEFFPIWKCCNCGHETPRIERHRRKGVVTPTQKRIVELIKREATEGARNERYHLEEWGTELLEGGTLMVRGRRVYHGADGNSPCWLNDTSFHASIGPRGKVDGNHYPGVATGGEKKFTRKNIYIINI